MYVYGSDKWREGLKIDEEGYMKAIIWSLLVRSIFDQVEGKSFYT